MMMVITLHVADGVNADQTAHKGRDDAHQHGQAVHSHMTGSFHRLGKFGPDHQSRLPYRQKDHRIFAVADTQANDQHHQNDLAGHHQVVDEFGFLIQGDHLSPAA